MTSGRDRPVAADPAAVAPVPGASTVNVANALTLLRLLLVPVVALLALAGDGHQLGWRIAAALAFGAASVTDRFDGEIARRRGLVTSFGKLADPIADKALTGTALVVLSALGQLPDWVTAVVLAREVGVTLLRFSVIRHGVIPASRGGKVKTFLQSLAIGCYLLPIGAGPLGVLRAVLMGVAVAVTLVTGVDYVARATALRRRGRTQPAPATAAPAGPVADAAGVAVAADAPAGGVTAELVAIGDELLDGDIVNANAAWLGAQLAAVGVQVTRASVVGDSEAAIVDALSTGLARTGLVLTTGGLGPTQDDLTREALATLAGVPLVRDDFLAAELTRRLTRAGRPMPARNLRQADLPRGATPLPNPRGTAPGIALPTGGGLVVVLPGPPHEMQAMFTESVLALLAARPGPRSVTVTRVLHTTGLWESDVADALAPELARLAAQGGGPDVAFLAAGGITRVKLTARAATLTAAREMLAPVEAAARAALGVAVFGMDDDSLPAVVLGALSGASATLSCAESLTGGLLSARLTEVAGASAVVRGGIVVYQTDSKTTQLGVPPQLLTEHGAVSAPAAAWMATAVRERFASTYGLALTGVAGPQRQEGKAAGTVFLALAGPQGLTPRELSLPGDRERVRTFAVVAALDLLRRNLAGR